MNKLHSATQYVAACTTIYLLGVTEHYTPYVRKLCMYRIHTYIDRYSTRNIGCRWMIARAPLSGHYNTRSKINYLRGSQVKKNTIASHHTNTNNVKVCWFLCRYLARQGLTQRLLISQLNVP